MRIVEIREVTKPIASPIRNAYIDFSKMTLSLVAVVTDAVRDGRRVVGYGFNSNGRYGQGALMRERFIPRILGAPPESLLDDAGENLHPHRVWAAMFKNEKPGGHGERSVAMGTIDMAVWDAVAKIAGKPLFRLLAERHGGGAATADPRVFVYAAGGYYYPGKDIPQLKDEMRSYLDRGYTVVKMKIGGAPLTDDLKRIEAVLGRAELVQTAPDGFETLYWGFRYLQGREAWEVDGAMIERYRLPLGPGVADRFAFAKAVTDAQVAEGQAVRERFTARFNGLLGGDAVLLLPTMPDVAPLLSAPEETLNDYRNKALNLLALSGLSGTPQVSMPLATRLDAPLGISLIGPAGSDLSLVRLAARLSV